uniref:Uncharacterized protein n=1 Tax=Romanomermis culicivorax TaxID=13658 RepID=A0A915J159_ROMCU
SARTLTTRRLSSNPERLTSGRKYLLKEKYTFIRTSPTPCCRQILLSWKVVTLFSSMNMWAHLDSERSTTHSFVCHEDCHTYNDERLKHAELYTNYTEEYGYLK